MKRCPQCEFIYEDDQSLCDMDGVLLVFDSRKLPNLHALTTVPAGPKTHRRSRAVPAFATLVLALVLGMVYYVSTRQPGYIPPAQPSAMTIAPVVIPTPEPQPSISEETPAPVQKPVAKKTTVAAPQTKRTTEPKKEDSKVNSILKKTGRILKKPFKKF